MIEQTPDATVGSLVRRGTVHVGPEATLREVAAAMLREECGALVVTSEGRSAGIVSERDVVRALAEFDDPDVARASDVMAFDITTISPDAPLSEAATQMLEGEIRHLPVVGREGPLGVLSIRDVLAAYGAVPANGSGQ